MMEPKGRLLHFRRLRRLPSQATGMFLGVGLMTASVARACAVCGGGNPANRIAFLITTIALTVLPLGLFVLAFLWLRSRHRARLADEFRDREPETGLLPASAAAPPREAPKAL